MRANRAKSFLKYKEDENGRIRRIGGNRIDGGRSGVAGEFARTLGVGSAAILATQALAGQEIFALSPNEAAISEMPWYPGGNLTARSTGRK